MHLCGQQRPCAVGSLRLGKMCQQGGAYRHNALHLASRRIAYRSNMGVRAASGDDEAAEEVADRNSPVVDQDAAGTGVAADAGETTEAGSGTEKEKSTGSAFSGRRRRSRTRQRAQPVSLDDFNPIALGRKSRQAFNTVVAADGENLKFDDLNPISMGRRSRQVFDDVWSQLQRIGGPSRASADFDDDLLPETFDVSQAEDSIVLVVGATGRVGRVLVRKLLIRGYRVKALVRRRGETEEDVMESIPQSVEVIDGDISDYKACRKAVDGVDKVIFCAAARSTLSSDVNRVDAEGVGMITRALQDMRNAAYRKAGMVAPTAKRSVADFGSKADQEAWDIMHCGPDEEDLEGSGYYAQTRRKALSKARDIADAYINEDDHLVFDGAVYSRNAYAIVGADLDEDTMESIAASDGLVMRLLGDGQTYSALLELEDGRVFQHRFKSQVGFATVRIPWALFSPQKISEDNLDDNLLDAGEIAAVGIQFEPSKKAMEDVAVSAPGMYDNAANRFKLEIDWIKALPGGIETDVVLVSCGGAQRSEWSFDASVRDRVVTAKRKGESLLRSSGLGYTIVRPGALVEEAGGYKALVFDQGNRISQPVACADVADVCLKALHDPTARNKTFEVCWEYTPEEGLEMYELVAHLPDKANNYLTPALSVLQSNT